MKGYYKIDERTTEYGVFELLESEKYGDEVPAKVVHNGVAIGETWDSLDDFLKEYLDQ